MRALNTTQNQRSAVAPGTLLRRLALGAVLLLATAGATAAPSIPSLPARTAEAGLPFIHNFDATDFHATPQNWSVTQGSNGVIYIGNVDDGILTFDGSHWQRIPVPGHRTVHTLTRAANGRIYVGTEGDFGYLAANPAGHLAYVSLLDKVPLDARDFSDVWSLHADAGDVYFGTRKYLFRLRDHQIRVLRPKTAFQLSFLIHGTLYVQEADRGLLRVEGNQLRQAPGGKRFAATQIQALLPWRDKHAKTGELLAATDTQGWWRYDGTQWKAWPTALATALPGHIVDRALWLADGRLAVVLHNDGIVLLDQQGRILQHLSQANGLGSNMVTALFQDRQQGLWLTTGQGASRIEVASPLSHFGAQNGLPGAVLSITRHQGVLYVGTTDGLFRLVTSAVGNTRFEQIPGIPGWDWSKTVDGQLLVATTHGLYAVEPDGTSHELLGTHHLVHLTAQALLPSRQDPARAFVAYPDGLGTLHFSSDHWIDEGMVRGIGGEPNTLAQESADQLWLTLWGGGIDRLTFPHGWHGPKDARQVEVEHFTTAAGLPSGQQQAVMIDGQTRFITENGIYQFDTRVHRFVPDPRFQTLFPDGPRQVIALAQGQHGILWMYTETARTRSKESGYAERTGNVWRWHAAPLQQISGNAVITIHADPDGTVWYGGFQGVSRYDPEHPPTPNVAFSALISSATTGGNQPLRTNNAKGQGLRVAYSKSAMRFEFAAPTYDDSQANRFQTRLQGVDPGWSPWGTDTFRDYTNLHEGDYVFQVRARNVYGQISKPTRLAFQVLPPWYRTWWARALWLIAGILVIGLAARWRAETLRRRNRVLTTLVDVRTAELADANQALQSSNRALARQSVTDPLTGLHNRRYLYQHIQATLATAQRRGQATHGTGGNPPAFGIVFLMLDIDHFKPINDAWGHTAGDAVLRQFGNILRIATRDTDVLTRWGGEEFLVVAQFAPADTGSQLAERIRATVATHTFDLGEGRTMQVTCSIGFAVYPTRSDASSHLHWEQVVSLADTCMYAAKAHGRNAWAGVSPIAKMPNDELLEALHASLADASRPGLLPVMASWTHHVGPVP